MKKITPLLFALVSCLLFLDPCLAPPAGAGRLVSPEIGADNSVTFRIRAPAAEKITLTSGGNIPQIPSPQQGPGLFWFSTGSEDFLLDTGKATVDMFRGHGFNVEFEESGGAHTWINWREYLNKFAPRLFR